MRITLTTAPSFEVSADGLVIFVREGNLNDPALRVLDRALGGQLRRSLKHHAFYGRDGQVVAVDAHGRLPFHQVLVIGLGKRTTPEAYRRAAAFATRVARGRVAVVAPTGTGHPFADGLQGLIEGLLLGQYRFEKYRKPKPDQRTVTEAIVMVTTRVRSLASKTLVRAEAFVRATVLARDLVNEPSGDVTPRRLAAEAEHLATQRGVRVKVFDAKQLHALGAGALLGVGRGSDDPPYLVHLSYVPRGARRSVALVGKGITFDSGGINLKPEKAMDNMKMDMAGAAAILGVFSVLPNLKPRVAVHGILALAENMPSGKALKPGDVLRAMDGTTIEVKNTDAEGRLVLADGLTYARKLKPQAMIDVATLTGACIVALGEDVAGLFSSNQKLTDGLQRAARAAGEPLWELPLIESYGQLIESDIADLKNVGKPGSAGAITAALFLKHFAKDTPWAHLDMAGPAWAEDDHIPYQPKGATGFGVRTLLRYLTT